MLQPKLDHNLEYGGMGENGHGGLVFWLLRSGI